MAGHRKGGRKVKMCAGGDKARSSRVLHARLSPLPPLHTLVFPLSLPFTRSSFPSPSPSHARLSPLPPLHTLVFPLSLPFTRSSFPFPSPSHARLSPLPPLHTLVFPLSLPFGRLPRRLTTIDIICTQVLLEEKIFPMIPRSE